MFLNRLPGLLLVLIALSAAGSAPAAEADVALQKRVERRHNALSRLVNQHSQVQMFDVDGRIKKIYGPAFGTGVSPEDTARQFRDNYSAVFGVPPSSLDPSAPMAGAPAVLPIMIDRQTGQFKFSLVYYTHKINGVPVFRSDLRLLVRNEAGFPLVSATSSLRDLGEFTLPAVLAEPRAANAVAAAQAIFPALKKFSEPKSVIWAGTEEIESAPVLAVQFTGESGDPAVPGYEARLFVADAATGMILYEENAVVDTDVTGNVSGLATELDGADICLNESSAAMPYARVNIGGTNAFADVNGDFTIPNPGVTDVTVDSPVRGQRFIVNDQAADTPTLSQNVTPPGPANFVHNSANTSEFNRASVNAYIQANVIRDIVVAANPAYPTIGAQVDMNVNTNINTFCNAFYSTVNGSINFYRTGGGCANTAFGDVVHHEYGHHVVQMGGSGQGQYGEGTGDCMAVLATDQPKLGIGFNLNCSTGIRTADNTLQYPCSGAIHFCGQLISGCVWDTRNMLVETEPLNYRQILADLTVNAVPLHAGSTITPQITVDFLTLDDTDANINNGTPHYSEIAIGFGLHNMTAPVVSQLQFQYPNGRPATFTPNQSMVIQVNVLADASTPVPGTGRVRYRVGTSGPFTNVAMTELLPNQYEATIPVGNCLEQIEYYFTAEAASTNIVPDPSLAPTTAFSVTSASGSTTVVDYDFQIAPAWTVAFTAADGQWDAAPGIPVNCNRGDPPTDFDGSGNCWLTDNSAASACNSDVDTGSTTLTSEIFDLSTASEPFVSYARWYSNTFGAEPEADVFVVEVSKNGGANWVNLETVGPTLASPNPEVGGGWNYKSFRLTDFLAPPISQFRIRFIAADDAGGSVIEAGIDAFNITDFACAAPCPSHSGDINNDALTNGDDIERLTSLLFGSPTSQEICAGDFNDNAALDPGDIGGFVDNLVTLP
jgi:hypothetical protein